MKQKNIKKKYRMLIFAGILCCQTAYASYGGNLQIVNRTQQPMNKTSEQSYKMETWNLPSTIPSNKSLNAHIEYEYNFLFGFNNDSKGDTYYQITCKNGTVDTIHVMTRIRNLVDRIIYPYIKAQETGNNCSYIYPADGYIGFKHDGTVTLYILPQ